MAFRITDANDDIDYAKTVLAGSHIRMSIGDYDDDDDAVEDDKNLLETLHDILEVGEQGVDTDIKHGDANASVYKQPDKDKLNIKLRTKKDRGRKSYVIALPKDIETTAYLEDILAVIASQMRCAEIGPGGHQVMLPEDDPAPGGPKPLTDLKDFLLAIITMSKCR